MAAYVVMEPPGPGARLEDSGAVFVRDAFSIVAFLVPVIWLLWHRLWIEAALILGLTIALVALGEAAGFAFLASIASILVSLYAGLEGAALRIAALRRRGWREAGVFEADGHDEAEARYLVEAEESSDGDVDFRLTPETRSAPRGPGGPTSLFCSPERP
jgi:Protein of unknown function (DUF2628)